MGTALEGAGDAMNEEESRVEDKARETKNSRESGRERVVKSYQKLFGIPEPRDGAFVSLT